MSAGTSERRVHLANDDNNSSNNESSNESYNQPENSDASSTSVDFLGRPPSHEPSESDQSPNQSSRESNEPEQPNKRPSRKQVKPKKRKDRVLLEIKRLKASIDMLIPKLPFQRLVREVLQGCGTGLRMQSVTLECLQEAAESYMVQLFEDCYLCCLHRARVTLSEKDVRIVQLLRGPSEVGRS